MTGGKHNPLNRDIHNDKTPNWGWFIFGFTTLKPLRLSHRWRRQEYLIYSGNFWVSFQVSNRTQRVSKLMRPLITQGSIIHTAALHAPNLDFYTEAKIQQGVAWQTGGCPKIGRNQKKLSGYLVTSKFPILRDPGPRNFDQQFCPSRQISDASTWRELAMCWTLQARWAWSAWFSLLPLPWWTPSRRRNRQGLVSRVVGWCVY